MNKYNVDSRTLYSDACKIAHSNKASFIIIE